MAEGPSNPIPPRAPPLVYLGLRILSIDIKMQEQIRYLPFSKPMNEQKLRVIPIDQG